MAEIDLIIGESANKTVVEEAEPPAVVEELAISKPGDLWLLGGHRILCGNALENSSFEQLMQGEKASLVAVDPPYNVPIDGHVGGLGKTHHADFAMACGEMGIGEFTEFLTKATRLLSAHSKDGSLAFLFQDWRHIREILAAGHAAYQQLLNVCVWVKDNGGLGSLYRSQHELVFVFKKGELSHRNNVLLGKHGRNRTNVWTYPGVNQFARRGEDGFDSRLHPTTKNLSMIADILLDASARKEVVLDSFLGSGTTLMAAERVGRRCYGMDIEPRYVDVAVRRWQRYTGDFARHATTGQQFDEVAVAVTASSKGKSDE